VTGHDTGRVGARVWWLRLVAAAGLAALLIPIGRWRMIDGDEGYILMAARLVSEGKRLYTDFFFPQMPLLADVYGAWFWLAGRSWYGARLFSALIAVGNGLLVLEILYRRHGRMRWALVGTAAYLAAGPVTGWFTIAKAFGPTAFLLSLAVLLLESAVTPLGVACGGLALALAAECRLYVVVAFPCAVLFLLRRYGVSWRGLRFVLFLAGGALVGGIVLLPYIVRDWHNFYFGAWVYHSIREYGQNGFVTNWPNKRETLLTVLYLDRTHFPGNLQFLGLTAFALLALFWPRLGRNRLASYLWPVLFVVSLIPSPAEEQYFCLLVPFLVVEAVEVFAALRPVKAWPLLAVLGLAFTILGGLDLERYLVTAQGVPGVVTRDRVPRWSIPTVQTVADKIDAANCPEGASWWPGYFVSTRTPINLRLANDFGFRAADHVSAKERRRLGIVTHAEVVAMMDRKSPRLFVAGNWTSVPENLFAQKGYREVAWFQNVKLWVAR
jgi:hypothetical protein